MIRSRDLYFTIENKLQQGFSFSQDETELLLYVKFQEAIKKSLAKNNNNTVEDKIISSATNTIKNNNNIFYPYFQ
jgi:hypothetical protein